jgi:hypothetical protein
MQSGGSAHRTVTTATHFPALTCRAWKWGKRAAHFLKVPHAGTISIRPSASILRRAAVTADLETPYSVANSATEGRRPSCSHSSAASRVRSAVSTRLLGSSRVRSPGGTWS